MLWSGADCQPLAWSVLSGRICIAFSIPPAVFGTRRRLRESVNEHCAPVELVTCLASVVRCKDGGRRDQWPRGLWGLGLRRMGHRYDVNPGSGQTHRPASSPPSFCFISYLSSLPTPHNSLLRRFSIVFHFSCRLNPYLNHSLQYQAILSTPANMFPASFSLLLQLLLLPLAIAAPVSIESHARPWHYGAGGGVVGFIVLILDIIVFSTISVSAVPHAKLTCE